MLKGVRVRQIDAKYLLLSPAIGAAELPTDAKIQAISKIVDYAPRTRQKPTQKRSIGVVCEHFKEAFNAVIEC